jgi:hypothetical protein
MNMECIKKQSVKEGILEQRKKNERGEREVVEKIKLI